MIKKRILADLISLFGKERIILNSRLSPYTSIKIGGPAEFLFEAHKDEELIAAVRFAIRRRLPFLVLGGGSNVIIDDKGFKGLTVINKTMSLKEINESEKTVLLRISSGYPAGLLSKKACERGYDGLQWYAGLPGTVGGAIYMNSKWTRPEKYFSENIEKITLIDRSGKIKKVGRGYFNFKYDYSKIQRTGEVVVDVSIRLTKADSKTLLKQAEEVVQYRKKTQPFGVFSSGCFFKNIDGKSAGKMIDGAGLKGMQIGDMRVSDKHANFLINRGKARAKDVILLARKIKESVKKKYDIDLENEVIFPVNTQL